MNDSNLKFLTDKQISDIHQKSLEILENIGIRVDSKKAREIFVANGCEIKNERVFLPAVMVDKISKKKQKKNKLYSRTGRTVDMSEKKIYVHNSGAVSRIVDSESGKQRDAKMKDAVDLVRLMDALDNIDAITPIVYPQGVKQELALLYAVKEIIKNTSKVFHGPGISSVFEAKYIYRMFTVLAGSEKKLREKPMVMFGFSPISPLILPEHDIDALIWSVRKGIPVAALPCPIAGLTAPITMLGSLTQQNAEILAVVSLVRMIDPSVPVTYSARLVHSDMRFGITDGGSPESGILGACAVQMAKYYDLESDVYGAGSSGIIADAQMGFEKANNIMMPAIAGSNWLSGTGSINDAAAVSYEQLVIDNEIFEFVFHNFGKLYDGNEDYGYNAINDVINNNHEFLMHENTVKYLRSEELWDRTASITSNCNYSTWYEDGSKDIAACAAERVEKILEKHEVEPLSEDVEKEIDNIIESARQEIE